MIENRNDIYFVYLSSCRGISIEKCVSVFKNLMKLLITKINH